MIPIHTVLGILLIMFAVVGSLRGWAKEVIVSFSVIVALFLEHVLLEFVPPVRTLYDNMADKSQFYTRSILFVIITVFGYATPSIASKIGAKIARERLQDLLLGFFLGVLNGFLVVGTLFSFLNAAHYGVAEGTWLQQQRMGPDNLPLVDQDGNPVMEVVYTAEAKGIGGILPPQPGTTAANLSAYLPPDLIAKSTAVLYLAVAAAFVFVIVVFI